MGLCLFTILHVNNIERVWVRLAVSVGVYYYEAYNAHELARTMMKSQTLKTAVASWWCVYKNKPLTNPTWYFSKLILPSQNWHMSRLNSSWHSIDISLFNNGVWTSWTTVSLAQTSIICQFLTLPLRRYIHVARHRYNMVHTARPRCLFSAQLLQAWAFGLAGQLDHSACGCMPWSV